MKNPAPVLDTESKLSLVTEEREKRMVALSSIGAAVLLTLMKLIAGYSTNSLGILSEAAHSGLDLAAAFITYLAVRMACKPADSEHHFGHGKAENISALIQTLLLLLTCIWIISEVIDRFSGNSPAVEVNMWSYIVVSISILVDVSRSAALRKVARKYKSQALEADALHFFSDIFSSGVVLAGLIGYAYGYYHADSFAALIVALIVIFISLKLGKKTIDVLLDKAPSGIKDMVQEIAGRMPEVVNVHDIRVRNSGAYTMVELNIHVSPGLSIDQAHAISHRVESKICQVIEKCEVHIHVEPDD